MSIQNAYNRWAETYDSDRNLTRDLEARVLREILADKPVGVTLEAGCGTGKNTPYLAELSSKVVGLDFSPGMLLQAREKVKSDQAGFTMADLTRPWPVASRAVDRVICSLVLEHIANLNFFFSEARRVLCPNGDFLISELHPYRQLQGVKANFRADAERIEIEAFLHPISDFIQAGLANSFALKDLRESWDSTDRTQLPRLVTLLFL